MLIFLLVKINKQNFPFILFFLVNLDSIFHYYDVEIDLKKNSKMVHTKTKMTGAFCLLGYKNYYFHLPYH